MILIILHLNSELILSDINVPSLKFVDKAILFQTQ